MEVMAIVNDHQENIRLQDLCKYAMEDYEYQQLQHYIHFQTTEARMQAVLECLQSASNRRQPHCLWLLPPHTVPGVTRHSRSVP